jgi:hypothetical protein
MFSKASIEKEMSTVDPKVVALPEPQPHLNFRPEPPPSDPPEVPIRRERRVFLASVIEIYAGIGFAVVYALGGHRPIEYLFNSIIFLSLLFYIFISIIQLMLFRTTPVVGSLLRARGFRIAGDSPIPASYTYSQEATSSTIDNTNIPEPTEAAILKQLQRSIQAVQIVQRRPNVLLFVGSAVAGAGLAFFFATLPELSKTDMDLWRRFMEMVPRILMLIFIQVLAGFFLRQYRAAMEEFRYYESILRVREAYHVSYLLRKAAADSKALAKLADKLLEYQEIGRLAKGQTNTVLEASKLSTNEYETIGRQVIDMINPTKWASHASNPK